MMSFYDVTYPVSFFPGIRTKAITFVHSACAGLSWTTLLMYLRHKVLTAVWDYVYFSARDTPYDVTLTTPSMTSHPLWFNTNHTPMTSHPMTSHTLCPMTSHTPYDVTLTNLLLLLNSAYDVISQAWMFCWRLHQQEPPPPSTPLRPFL